MHRIKVAHVTQGLGGIKTFLDHLFTNSNMDCFEYVIIAPEDKDFLSFCKKMGIQYYPLNISRSVNIFKDLSALTKIASILRREKPDVVHAHSAKGGVLGRLAAKLISCKVIYSPHAFSYLSFHGVKRMFFYMLEYFARKFTTTLLAVSHSEAGRAIHELNYKPQDVTVAVNAIPVVNSLPFRNYTKCTTIGMIGRLTHQKNPLLFLEVAAMLLKRFPNLKFSILGAGLTDHLSTEIDQYIKEHRLQNNVSIQQWGNHDTSRKFMEELDIFVLTSVFEGLPFSLIEAMAQGVPCVVSKVDGNTDVIQNNENGYSCLSASEFCTRLSTLIQSEDLRRKFGQAGYRYVKEMHDIKDQVSKIEGLYRQHAKREVVIKLKEPQSGVAINKRFYSKVGSNL